MATDLHVKGNHTIQFKSKGFKELTKEIKEKLDKATLINADFLKSAALDSIDQKGKTQEEIDFLMNNKKWIFQEENEYYNFAEDKDIVAHGPFNLKLTFEEHVIVFWDPSFRYREWLEMEDKTRNEWRKYMHQIVTLFGGDRVLYLADNSHPLENFIYIEGPIKKIEKLLETTFGEPKRSLREVANNPQTSYFIDKFTDLQ